MPRIEIVDEQCVTCGLVRKAFPLSHASRYISLQDGLGKELGMIRDLADLDPDSRQVVEEELDRRYFTPKISQITLLKQEGGMWTWQVETSRGPATFYVRSWRDSSHEISAGRFLIQSVDGQRYEIPSYDDLDDRSKLFIEQLF